MPDMKIDEIGSYLQQIGRYPVLSRTEEYDLMERIRRGDRDAYEHFIHCNLKLVASLVKRYTGNGVPTMDLIQEGNIGLMHAVDLFDHTKGYKFSTYAIRWIMQHMQRALHERGMVHVPEHKVVECNRLARIETHLYEELEHEPTNQELALAAGMSVEQVRQLREWIALPVSIDEARNAARDADYAWIDTIEDGQAADELDNSERRMVLDDALSLLKKRERAILEMRYGLENGMERPLQAIGDELCRSKERIRQIEEVALGKLRERLESRECAGVA